MKISAVNMTNFTTRNLRNSQHQNFTGIFISRGTSSDEDIYEGSPSGSSYDGHYHTTTDEEYYTYHPFADESEREIEKVLKENNYSSSGDYGGIFATITRSTERGSRLEFTEREWKNLSKSTREKIERML